MAQHQEMLQQMANSYRRELAVQKQTIGRLNRALAAERDLGDSLGLDTDVSEELTGRAQAPPRPAPLPESGAGQQRFAVD